MISFPPMNRRAIGGRPYGTNGSRQCFQHFPRFAGFMRQFQPLEFRECLRDVLFPLPPENDAAITYSDSIALE